MPGLRVEAQSGQESPLKALEARKPWYSTVAAAGQLLGMLPLRIAVAVLAAQAQVELPHRQASA